MEMGCNDLRGYGEKKEHEKEPRSSEQLLRPIRKWLIKPSKGENCSPNHFNNNLS